MKRYVKLSIAVLVLAMIAGGITVMAQSKPQSHQVAVEEPVIEEKVEEIKPEEPVVKEQVPAPAAVQPNLSTQVPAPNLPPQCPEDIKGQVEFYRGRIETLRTVWYEPTKAEVIEKFGNRDNITAENIEEIILKTAPHFSNPWKVAHSELDRIGQQHPECL